MGKPKPPSHLFIARHGYRLDTADKNWHFTSAEPYNPPLTYGGFTQTRGLGSRISSLVHTRPKDSKDGRAKEVRFIIHTSPYLRCIQTSLAVAEGIAQYCHQQNTNTRYPGAAEKQGVDPEPVHFQKPLVRVDAFLGEWLTPDYFSDISPPPGFRIMVASAIGDLARTSSISSASALPITPLSTSPLDTITQISASLPALSAAPKQAYTQLQPTWAIGSREPIPRGFVSHAKSYAEIDFGWDSFRFGDGGEYGEEWSTMQKRFRSGLGRLLEWYKTEDSEVTSRTTTFGGRKRRAETGNPSPPLSDGGSETEEEDEVETIVIVVTHGGGCNAMLGALTDQPALTDVPIASLTMGTLASIQPQSSSSTANTSPTTTPASSIYLSRNTPSHLPLKYNLALTNSTTHLRRQSDSLPPSRSSSIRATPTTSTSHISFANPLTPAPPPTSFTLQSTSGLLTRSASTDSTPSYLWSKIEPSLIEVSEEVCVDEDEGFSGFGSNLGAFGRKEREREREMERERDGRRLREKGGDILREKTAQVTVTPIEGGMGLWERPK